MPRDFFITASQTKPLMVDGRVRKPFGRGAVTLARELARTWLGVEAEDFDSEDIDRGNEQEDEAIAFFEREHFREVKRPGFLEHPEIAFFGGTPDGIVGTFGIDIKCTNQKNHHDNLSEGMQLDKYKHQFQSYMELSGLDRWALVSYNRDFPENSRLAIEFMKRDNEYIDKLLSRVEKFYPLVQEEMEKLKQYEVTI